MAEKPSQTHDDYKWTVYTTWRISFDRLSLPAAMFLQLCSFLHRDGISEDIFSKAIEYNFPEWGPSKEQLQMPLEFLSQFLKPTSKWDSLRFSKVTNEIRAYSLINFDPERKTFSIHPLVHSWCQLILDDPESYLSYMNTILGMTICTIPGHDMQLASLILISHVDALMDATPEMTSVFSMHYAHIYLSVGQYTKAEEIGVITMDKYMKLFGDDHPVTVNAMRCLALTYEYLGHYKECQKLRTEVLEKWRKLLGDDHPDTMSTMNNLAVTYRHLGQHEEAEKLQVEVLEKQRKLLGDDHPDTLIAMQNLAVTYSKLDQHEEAEKLEVEVLKKRRRLLGDDHPVTLSAMENLAVSHYHLDQFQQAEDLQVVVLEKRRKLLGDSHPDTRHAMRNLDKLTQAKEFETFAEDESWTPKIVKDSHVAKKSVKAVLTNGFRRIFHSKLSA
jgi:tetratricopeptide (TPR) repeat protein